MLLMSILVLIGLGCLWLQTVLFALYFMYPTSIDGALYFGPKWSAMIIVFIISVALGGSLFMLFILTESFLRVML